jgi:hypothetical protein
MTLRLIGQKLLLNKRYYNTSACLTCKNDPVICSSLLIRKIGIEKCFLVRQGLSNKNFDDKKHLFDINCVKCLGNAQVCSSLWLMNPEKMIKWRLFRSREDIMKFYLTKGFVNCITFANFMREEDKLGMFAFLVFGLPIIVVGLIFVGNDKKK